MVLVRKWDKNNKDIITIIKHYGSEAQKHKAIEELNELAVAIAHNDIENIQEEMADVIIMLAQLMEIYDFDDLRIFRIIDYKIRRTIIRIGAENENQEKTIHLQDNKTR